MTLVYGIKQGSLANLQLRQLLGEPRLCLSARDHTAWWMEHSSAEDHMGRVDPKNAAFVDKMFLDAWEWASFLSFLKPGCCV